MGKLFNLDSPFVQFMNRVADIMWLNILFILCSLPIFTIGASTTAMYYVTLKMVRNEESYITKSFFKSFKQNFRQATVIFLLIVLVGAVFVLDYFIITGRFGVSLGNSTFATVFQVALAVVFGFYVFTCTFVFPLLAKFDNSIKNTIKNALLMSIRHFPTTLLCVLGTILTVVLIIFVPIMIVLSFFLVFALLAFCLSYLYMKVFEKYMPAEESEAAEGDVLPETVSEETDIEQVSE